MANNVAERYIDLYKQLHTQDPHYGTTSIRWLPVVQHYVSDLNPDSVLDFGCGKNALIKHLKTARDIPLYCYDPAVAEFSKLPVDKAGMVLCIDVMEHIPEDTVEDVLKNIRSLSEKVFFNISCTPAWNKLPDGSNAHCTVYPPEWWEKRLTNHFDYVEIIPVSNQEDALFITWRAKSHFTPRYRTLKKIVRPLINLICILTPVRKWRHYLRDMFSKI